MLGGKLPVAVGIDNSLLEVPRAAWRSWMWYQAQSLILARLWDTGPACPSHCLPGPAALPGSIPTGVTMKRPLGKEWGSFAVFLSPSDIALSAQGHLPQACPTTRSPSFMSGVGQCWHLQSPDGEQEPNKDLKSRKVWASPRGTTSGIASACW